MTQIPTISSQTPTLVSFSICPFVQRSVIALLVKKIKFDRLDIDLSDKPSWFLERVPTAKVPALLLNGEVLFESAVISEFLDESYGTPLLAPEPLGRAKERAWIAFASQLLGSQYALLKAKTEEEVNVLKAEWIKGILAIGEHTQGTFYNGKSLSLLDTAIAPLFTRLRLIPSLYNEVVGISGKDSALVQWINAISEFPEVKQSVSPQFEKQFTDHFKALDSFLLRDLDEGNQ